MEGIKLEDLLKNARLNEDQGKNYHATPLKVSIHHKLVNPIFGDGVTHVEIEDEASGPFIILTQEYDGVINKISLDMEELELIMYHAGKLIDSYEPFEE
ncbi:MAG: hypothetical protein ACOC1K_03605 [Nanoarchaeota archaeon]